MLPRNRIDDRQGSLFSKAYRPLASSTSQLVLFHHHFWGGGPLPCPLLGGGLFHVHCWGGGSSSMSISGGSSSMSTSWWVLFCVHFQGGSSSVSTSGGSHVTYPIMLLYITVECSSASWAKFTWNLPPPPPEMNRLTDRRTLLKTLPSRTLRMWAVTTTCTISIHL